MNPWSSSLVIHNKTGDCVREDTAKENNINGLIYWNVCASESQVNPIYHVSHLWLMWNLHATHAAFGPLAFKLNFL